MSDSGGGGISDSQVSADVLGTREDSRSDSGAPDQKRDNDNKVRNIGAPSRYDGAKDAGWDGKMKTCSKCRKTKPTCDFQRKSCSTDGFRGQCKACHNPLRRALRKRRKEKAAAVAALPQSATKQTLEGMKICTTCLVLKSYDDFRKNACYNDGYSGTCTGCKNIELMTTTADKGAAVSAFGTAGSDSISKCADGSFLPGHQHYTNEGPKRLKLGPDSNSSTVQQTYVEAAYRSRQHGVTPPVPSTAAQHYNPQHFPIWRESMDKLRSAQSSALKCDWSDPLMRKQLLLASSAAAGGEPTSLTASSMLPPSHWSSRAPPSAPRPGYDAVAKRLNGWSMSSQTSHKYRSAVPFGAPPSVSHPSDGQNREQLLALQRAQATRRQHHQQFYPPLLPILPSGMDTATDSATLPPPTIMTAWGGRMKMSLMLAAAGHHGVVQPGSPVSSLSSPAYLASPVGRKPKYSNRNTTTGPPETPKPPLTSEISPASPDGQSTCSPARNSNAADDGGRRDDDSVVPPPPSSSVSGIGCQSVDERVRMLALLVLTSNHALSTQAVAVDSLSLPECAALLQEDSRVIPPASRELVVLRILNDKQSSE